MVILFSFPVLLSVAETLRIPLASISKVTSKRNSSWCWGDASQLKFAQNVVVSGHSSLSFKDLNQYTRLVIGVSGEDLSLILWNGGVPLNKSSHHTSSSLNTKRKRSNIKQKQILDFLRFISMKDGSLHSCSISNSLIRVDALVKFFLVEVVQQKFLDFGNTCR